MKRCVRIISLTLVIVITMAIAACGQDKQTFSRVLQNSGTAVEITLKGKNESAVADNIFSAMQAKDESLFGKQSALTRFNAADGEIFEGELNVIGHRDKRMRIEADHHLYSAVNTAKALFQATDEAFSVTSARLIDRWINPKAGIPTDDEIARDIRGVQLPYLIDTRTIDGKYYLEKDVVFDESGALNEEHTLLDFGIAAGGIMCDAVLSAVSGEKLSHLQVCAGNTVLYVGSGSLRRTITLSTGDELCSVVLPSGKTLAHVDVYDNALTIDELFIGGIVDSQTGIPTTLIKSDRNTYANAADYVFAAVVIADSGMKADAFCLSAAIRGEKSKELLEKNDVSALIFTKTGKIYVVGDIQYTLAGSAGNYEIIRL